MNTLIKRAMLAAGITTAMVLPLAGRASDGMITFTGAVTASTCTVNVNGAGSANATVALPTVDTAALSGAAGTATTASQQTAAGTFFNVVLSDCSAATDIGDPAAAPTTVAIYFEAGATVDEGTGGLINTAGTGVGYSNVEVKLYNASGSSVVGTQIMPGTPTNQPTALTIANGGGTQWFYAGYATLGTTAATAGAVSTYVTYSLVYN